MPTPTLRLLSGFELAVEGRPLRVPRSAQRLLVFLALQRRPLLRIYIAGMLWMESDESHANASLRSALWRLQRLPCALVRATSSSLAIVDDVVVDVGVLDDTAHDVLAGRPGTDGFLDRLCGAGDLLPDWYDEWLVVERERLRQLRLHALDAACRQLAEVGRHSEAAEVGLASVAAEPLRESAHRALIEVHLAEGNLVEAVRQYETYRQFARRHLGIEPSRELAELVTPAATRR
jgi:DNA-binding SARP family transcriptional activator